MPRHRANELLEAGDVAGALVELRAAVARAPDDAEALNLLGTALVRAGDLDAAEQAYSASVLADPLLHKPHANLANLLTKSGRHAEAVERLRQAVALAPDAERLWRRLGESLERAGRDAEASEAFERSLVLRSSTRSSADAAMDLTPELARRLTPVALRAGLFDVALALARRALSAAPGDQRLVRVETACLEMLAGARATRALIDSFAQPPPEQAQARGLLLESGADRLHIGGKIRKPGWKILNALAGEHVDYVGDMRDLSQFADASFDMVYASHVLEHVGYQRELAAVLRSIVRVLRAGGRFFVSVPDLEVLCRLFSQSPDPALRFRLMRMMFGGQVDAFDFHQVGLWDAYLSELLRESGFAAVHRVASFDLFDDTNTLRVNDVLISLNLVAVR